MNQFDDVVIGDQRYSVGRLKADTGAWILQQLLNSLREASKGIDFTKIQDNSEEVKPSPEDSLNGMVQILLSTSPRSLFSEIQKIALGVVGQYKLVGTQDVAVPIIRADGSFNSKELEYNISGVTQLTQKVLVANLLPFFQSSESKQ